MGIMQEQIIQVRNIFYYKIWALLLKSFGEPLFTIDPKLILQDFWHVLVFSCLVQIFNRQDWIFVEANKTLFFCHS